MMRLILLLSAGVLAHAQITFTVPFNTTDSNPVWNDTGATISVGGTGAYTVTLSQLPVPCLELARNVAAAPTSTTAISGTAPDTVSIRPRLVCSGNGGPGIGTHAYTATISGSEARVVTVTVRIVRSWEWPVMRGTNKLSTYSGPCGDLWRGNFQNCGYTPTRPGNWIPPAVGATYTDPVFGTTIRRLVTGDIHRYSNQHMVNYDETHLLTLNGLVRLSDGVYEITYDTPTRNLDLRWVPEYGANPRLYSMLEGDTGITIYTRSGSTLTQQSRIECGIGQLNSWFNGASRDGWVARSNYANTHICLVNVLTGRQWSAPAAHPDGAAGRDNLYISRGRDRVTGLHYLWYGGYRGAVYSFGPGATTLTPVTLVGLSAVINTINDHQTVDAWKRECDASKASIGHCYGQDHVDTVEVDGEQAVVSQTGNVTYFNRLRPDDLSAMNSIQGGILPEVQLLGHVGCASTVPLCAGSFRRSLSQNARNITAMSGSGTITVTMDGSLAGLANGQTVHLSGMVGCANMIGDHVVSGVSGSTFTVSGTCSPAYSSGGAVVRAVMEDSGYGFNRIIVTRPGAARSFLVVGDHRSPWFSGAGDDYFSGQPWAFVSPRGQYVIWKSNLGTPNQQNIMIADISAWSNPPQLQLRPTQTTIAASWSRSAGGGISACTMTVSPNIDMSSATTPTVTLTGNTFSATATGLTAGTPYYVQVDCDNYVRATERITTRP